MLTYFGQCFHLKLGFRITKSVHSLQLFGLAAQKKNKRYNSSFIQWGFHSSRLNQFPRLKVGSFKQIYVVPCSKESCRSHKPIVSSKVSESTKVRFPHHKRDPGLHQKQRILSVWLHAGLFLRNRFHSRSIIILASLSPQFFCHQGITSSVVRNFVCSEPPFQLFGIRFKIRVWSWKLPGAHEKLFIITIFFPGSHMV